MKTIVDYSRDLSIFFTAMFTVIALGGIMRGLMLMNGGFLQLGALAAFFAVSFACYLRITRSPFPTDRGYLVFLAFSASVAFASVLYQFFMFVVWYFEDYLDAVPSLDMSYFKITGPLFAISLLWGWRILDAEMKKFTSN